MVTTNPENVFQKLIQRDRWDLKDMKKKDEWLLRTGTLLHKAGVAVALKNGRPTIAKIKAVQPKLGLRTMQVMLENLVLVYEEQISVAFDVLVNRLDLSDAWLCSEVTRHMGTRDGQAVWDLIQKECDMSTGVKQDAVVSKWEHFSIPANVSPVQLREHLSVSPARTMPTRSAQARWRPAACSWPSKVASSARSRSARSCPSRSRATLAST